MSTSPSSYVAARAAFESRSPLQARGDTFSARGSDDAMISIGSQVAQESSSVRGSMEADGEEEELRTDTPFSSFGWAATCSMNRAAHGTSTYITEPRPAASPQTRGPGVEVRRSPDQQQAPANPHEPPLLRTIPTMPYRPSNDVVIRDNDHSPGRRVSGGQPPLHPSSATRTSQELAGKIGGAPPPSPSHPVLALPPRKVLPPSAPLSTEASDHTGYLPRSRVTRDQTVQQPPQQQHLPPTAPSPGMQRQNAAAALISSAVKGHGFEALHQVLAQPLDLPSPRKRLTTGSSTAWGTGGEDVSRSSSRASASSMSSDDARDDGAANMSRQKQLQQQEGRRPQQGHYDLPATQYPPLPQHQGPHYRQQSLQPSQQLPGHQSRWLQGGDANGLMAQQASGRQQQQSPGCPMPSMVHMRRSEAWARFAAYEGCIQVVLQEPQHEAAREFLSDGFSKLRCGFRVESLLLRPDMDESDMHGQGIHWDDVEQATPDQQQQQQQLHPQQLVKQPTSRRYAAAAVPPQTSPCGGDGGGRYSSTPMLRVRVMRLVVPGHAGLMAKLVGRGAPDCRGLVVCLSAAPGPQHGGVSCPAPILAPLDRKGAAPSSLAALHLSPEQSRGLELMVTVQGSMGPLAQGRVKCDEMWSNSAQMDDLDGQRPDTSRSDRGPAGPATLTVAVEAHGSCRGKPLLVYLSVQQYTRQTQSYEPACDAVMAYSPASSAAATSSVPGAACAAVRGNAPSSLRLTKCLAYDCVLESALQAQGCSRSKLTIEGSWAWLLARFSSHFGVHDVYCLLAHLRWVLKPGVASITKDCLKVIALELKPLLEQEQLQVLSTQEVSLLERIKHHVTQLLEMAFENYYMLVEDAPRAAMHGGGDVCAGWRPDTLEAALELFDVLRAPLQHADIEWLNARFRAAARQRWRNLTAGCGGVADSVDFTAATAAAAAGAGWGQQHPSQVALNQPFRTHRRTLTQRPGSGGGAVGGGRMPSGTVHGPSRLDALLKRMEKICVGIRGDLELDLHLQALPRLIPGQLNLPYISVEEYCCQFVEELKRMLHASPPPASSPPAVELFVTVASMQRFLQAQDLMLPKPHVGHLDALELFRPHVLSWVTTSQEALCAQCRSMEVGGLLQGAAAPTPLDPAKKLPGLTESVEGAVSSTVSDMLLRLWTELGLYERILTTWPAFGPPVEAAACKVLRSILTALCAHCAMAKERPAAETPGSVPRRATLGGGPARSPAGDNGVGPSSFTPPEGGFGRRPNVGGYGGEQSALQPGLSQWQNPQSLTKHASMARGHGRVGSAIPAIAAGGTGGGTMATHGRSMSVQPGVGGRGGGGTMHSPTPQGPAAASRVSVLMKEAVLGNSLKYLMLCVPLMEDMISGWCGGAGGPNAQLQQQQQLGGGHNARSPAAGLDDTPYIGAQMAQVVKELRTEYACAVGECAGRIAAQLRMQPATNIRAALGQPFRTPDSSPHQQTQQMSSMAVQKEAVDNLMSPLLTAVDGAMASLRMAVDPRVFVAIARALWDCVGRDLFEFVEQLQEGNDNRGAWRLRQHAAAALSLLSDFMRQRIAQHLDHRGLREKDLDPPANVSKAMALLGHGNAATNLSFTPF